MKKWDKSLGTSKKEQGVKTLKRNEVLMGRRFQIFRSPIASYAFKRLKVGGLGSLTKPKVQKKEKTNEAHNHDNRDNRNRSNIKRIWNRIRRRSSD